jgi:hypothetical protein
MVANDYMRIAIAILICFAPGMREVGGNLANLHWILYLYSWLVLVSPPETKFAIFEIVIIGLCFLSCGEAIVLLPLLAVRQWLTRKCPNEIKIQNLILLLMLVISVSLNLAVRGSDEPMQIANLSVLGHALGVTLAQQIILIPFVGTTGIYKITKNMNFWFLVLWSFLILSVCGTTIWRQASKRIVFGGLLLTIGVPLMTWIVRAPSIHYYSVIAPPISYFEIRYAFQLAPYAIIFWFLFFDIFKGARNWILPSIFFALYLSALANNKENPHKHQFPAFSISRSWNHDAAALIGAVNTHCPREAFTPIFPEGWGFTFTVPEKDRTSPCP